MNYPQSDQIPLAPPRVPRRIAERKAEIENKINQSFRKSLENYSTSQTFALFSFLSIIIGIEISEYLLPLCFTVLAVFYFFYLIRIFCDSFSPVDKAQTGYKILEFVVTVGLLINFRKPDDNGYLYICGTFLLVSFLIKAFISYMANHSNTVKFMNMANKIVAIINACIFAQGAALLAQLSAGNPVPFVLVLIPTLVMTGFIALFSARLFEFIFFTYRSQFWDSDVGQKKKGIVWLFGNLISLVFLLLSSFVSFCGVESKPKDSFVGLYFIIVIWCTISVCTLGSAKNGLYGIYYTLVVILETKEEADEMQKIKFVIKISNTYYRQATDQEVKQSKNQKHNVNANDTEVELGNKGEEGVKCIVCCKDAPDSVFMLCGHGGVCFECAQEIRKKQECHMCRQRIKGLLKLNIENNKGNVYEVMTAVTTKDDEEEA